MISQFSVTTPASDLSLLTIEELRAACGVTGTAEDAALTTLGLRLSTAIARACGVASDGVNPPTLLRETCTEVFRPKHGRETLVLSRRPVTSIASLVESGTALEPADYEIHAASGIVSRLCGDVQTFWSCGGKITVVYVAGYQTAPSDLKLAASKLATALYAETARDPNLKREEVPGVMTQEFWVGPATDPLLSQEISDLLAPFRQRWF